MLFSMKWYMSISVISSSETRDILELHPRRDRERCNSVQYQDCSVPGVGHHTPSRYRGSLTLELDVHTPRTVRLPCEGSRDSSKLSM